MSTAPTGEGARSRASLLAPLRGPPYRRLWSARLVSYAGDRAHQIALPVYVGLATGSALAVGLVFASISLAYILLAPIAGPLVDRWDRRGTMIVSDLVRAVLVLATPTLLAIDVRLAYVASFLLTSASLFFRPAELSLLPELVKEDELVQANSLMSLADTGMDLLGFAAAGVAVSVVGPVPAFYFDSLTYLVSALLIARIPSYDVDRVGAMPSPADVLHDFSEGARFLWHQPALRANTALFFLGPVSLGVVTALTPMFSIRVLGTGAWGFGVLESSMGLGSLLGGYLVGRHLSGSRKGPVILAGFLVMSLATVAMGLTRQLPLAGVAFAASGAGNMLFFITSISFVQQVTPPRMRARIFSLRMVIVQAGLMLSAAGGGSLADSLGIPTVFVLAGLAMMVATGLAGTVSALRELK